jgi:glycosyl transferase, family 25
MIVDKSVNIKVFVISLKRSVDRKAHMEKQLGRLNMAYEFVDAIDGQRLSDYEITAKYGVRTFPPWPSINARPLVKGEIGCLLSHLKVYEKMIHEDIEYACIFEDDAIFEKDLGTLLETRLLEISDYELLLLGHIGRYHKDALQGAECSSHKEKAFSRYHIAKPIESPYGTYAYIIKQSAALKLLQHAYPLRMPMDFLTAHSPAARVNLSVLTPPIVTVNEGLFASTICERDQNDDLYFYKARRIRKFLGRKYPILRTIKKICLSPYVMLPLSLRKAGLFDWDTYAEERLFHKSLMKLPVWSPTDEMDRPFEHD